MRINNKSELPGRIQYFYLLLYILLRKHITKYEPQCKKSWVILLITFHSLKHVEHELWPKTLSCLQNSGITKTY